MIKLAKLLVAAAFLAGAFLAALDPLRVDWLTFLPVVAAGVLGVLLVKYQERAEARSSDRLAGHRKDLEASLGTILHRLEALEGRKDSVPTYEMRFEIDRLLRDELDRFAEARDSMKHLFGLRTYADIMSSFAAGERYLNRVWSASTDGYVDEVLIYIEKALAQFRAARAAFERALAARG